MITSSRPMRGWRAVSACVDAGVDGADVRRAREQHRRLLAAPLVDLVRARELAGAVQRAPSRRSTTRVHGSPPCGQTAVTPVWSGTWLAWPTRTPATSVIAFAGPVGSWPDDEAVVACAHRPKLAGTH